MHALRWVGQCFLGMDFHSISESASQPDRNDRLGYLKGEQESCLSLLLREPRFVFV